MKARGKIKCWERRLANGIGLAGFLILVGGKLKYILTLFDSLWMNSIRGRVKDGIC